jgi:D-alanyl-D-alanine carboxypeptidase
LLLALLLAGPYPALAQTLPPTPLSTPPPPPPTRLPASAPTTISAASAILVDLSNNQVLLDREMHRRRAVASLTKVLTAVVALKYGALTDEIVVDERDLPGEASIGLKAGDRLPLETAMFGMLMRSGNDAAAAIARSIGERVAVERGQPGQGMAVFLELMNQTAASLGMSNSRFVNPHGLDVTGHYSTAYDLALLTRHAMENPTFARIFEARSYPFRDRLWTNVNQLLYRYDGLIGGKTGIESQSGLCLIELAQRDRRLLVVVLNAPQWYADASALLDYGFGDSRQLPAGPIAGFGAASPLSGPPPLPLNLAATRPVPVATPELITVPVSDNTGSGPGPGPTPRPVYGASDLSASGSPGRNQSAEGDTQVLLIAAIVIGLLIAFGLISIALRSLGLGPLAGRRWPDEPPGRSPLASPELERPRRSVRSLLEPAAPEEAAPTHTTAESEERLTHPGPPLRSPANQAEELAAAHIAVAIRYLNEGRHEAAESTFVKAIQVVPDGRLSGSPALWQLDAEGYLTLASAYLRCNRPVDARAVVAIGLIEYSDHTGLRTLDDRLQAERRRTR